MTFVAVDLSGVVTFLASSGWPPWTGSTVTCSFWSYVSFFFAFSDAVPFPQDRLTGKVETDL